MNRALVRFARAAAWGMARQRRQKAIAVAADAAGLCQEGRVALRQWG